MLKLSREEYLKNLPRKIVGAGVLFFDAQGRVLLVKPNYRDGWLIPGGTTDANEAPRVACIREVKEEIGLVIEAPELITVGYTIHKEDPAGDGLIFIFYGGVLNEAMIQSIVLQKEELDEYRFVSQSEALAMVTRSLQKSLPTAFQAAKEKTLQYIEIFQ